MANVVGARVGFKFKHEEIVLDGWIQGENHSVEGVRQFLSALAKIVDEPHTGMGIVVHEVDEYDESVLEEGEEEEVSDPHGESQREEEVEAAGGGVVANDAGGDGGEGAGQGVVADAGPAQDGQGGAEPGAADGGDSENSEEHTHEATSSVATDSGVDSESAAEDLTTAQVLELPWLDDTRYPCPIDGCTRELGNAGGLVSHVNNGEHKDDGWKASRVEKDGKFIIEIVGPQKPVEAN